MPATTPFVKGTLDTLVLKALNWATMHGFEITTWLEARTKGALEVDDSALYQALYRLEARGLIHAHWGVTENNRRARYYELRAAGRVLLKEQTADWVKYANAVTSVLLSHT
jgi:transcriptional regulator